MKKFILFSVLLFTAASYAQNINGRLSSSIYTFERFDTAGSSDTHIRAYEQLSLNINKDNVSLRSYLNFETGFGSSMDSDPRLRVYNLYLEARELLGIATLKLGRQPLIVPVAAGNFDGVNLQLKHDNYKLQGFYGGNVPAYQKLEITDQWKDDFVAGGRFQALLPYGFDLQLSYINKNFKPQEYWAVRLDTDLNPIDVLIRNNSTQYELGTAELSYEMEHLFSVSGRYDYDFSYNTSSKIEFFGTYEQVKNLRLNVYYNHREPNIRYNSIFSVFDFGNTQEIEAGADYDISKMFTVSAKFATIEYKEDNSQRITAGVFTPYGTVTYRKNLGYAGEMDAVSVYAAHSFMEGKITPSLGLSFTNYKLSQDDETNNLTTLLAGLNVRPWREVSMDIQGQYLNNKIYRNDYRLFLRLNYWFNSNLNLM